MALRILHTADWHLGQTLRGWSREAEHRAALDAILSIAVSESVDALILAGDVYDTTSPSPATEALFYHTLGQLKRAIPHLTTVVVAGNHDPAGRLEAPHPLAGGFDVHLAGTLTRTGTGLDLARHLIALRDRDGAVQAQVLALPFLRLSDLPPRSEGTGTAASWYASALQTLHAEATAQARAQIGSTPLIVVGHLTVAGGGPEDRDAERAILIGGVEGVDHTVFGPDPVYVALGHIHHAGQAGALHVRYAGSLFPLSASERSLRHSVTIVEIEAGTATSRPVFLPRPVPFLRVPETGSVRLDGFEAALKSSLHAFDVALEMPVEHWPFVVAHVEVEGPSPGLAAEIDAIVRRHPVRLVDSKLARPPGSAEPVSSPLVEPLAEQQPEALFDAAFLREWGYPPGEAHRNVFRAALEAAR